MLKEKIQADLKEAIKEKEEFKFGVLRLLLAVILNKEKEKRYKISREKPELSKEGLEKESQICDEEAIEVISSEIKRRKEAILLFEKGKREDLAQREKEEIEILQKYLPEQIPEEEIRKLAKEAIERTGAKEAKDTGRVMAELMPKVKGKSDGTTASKIVRELLMPKQ